MYKQFFLLLIGFFLILSITPSLTLAWWDSGYNYRYPILSNSTSSNMVVYNNDSYGICGRSLFVRNCTSCYVYCSVNGCCSGNIAIATDSTAINFELDNNTGTNYRSVWSDLVGVWHLDEKTGITAWDSTGTLNLTHTNAPTLNQIGVFNRSVYYVSDDHSSGTSTNATWLNFMVRDFTIIYSINTTSQIASYRSLGLKDADGSDLTFDFAHNYNYNNCSSASLNHSLCVFIYDNGLVDQTLGSAINVTNGQYHTIAVRSYNATNISLWVDGVLQRFTTWDSDFNGTSVEKIAIGSRWTDAGANADYLTGQIDELRIYGRALTDNEIMFYYNNTKSTLTDLGIVEMPPIATTVYLYLDGLSANKTMVYSATLNITAKLNTSDGVMNVVTYINNSIIANQSIRTENISTIGWFANKTYNISAYYFGNNTYLPSNATYWLFVEKGSSGVIVGILPATNVNAGTTTYTTCNITTGSAGNLTLYRDGTYITNSSSMANETVTLPVGNYNYTCTYQETENYTSSSSNNNMLLVLMQQQIDAISKKVFNYMILNDERKLSNHNTCINDTLMHNITYSIDGTLANTYIYENCTFGCDNKTMSCSPSPPVLNLWYLGALVVFAILIILFRRLM